MIAMLSLNFHTLKTSALPLLAVLFLVQGCYSLPMEDIEHTKQYSAKELIHEWRRYSSKQPLQPVRTNDDYYAPYTPQIINRNANIASPSNPAYYYDPTVDNPQPSSGPYIADMQSNDSYPANRTLNNVVTNDLLYAY